MLTLVLEVNGGRSEIVVREKPGFDASKGVSVMIASPIGRAARLNLTLAMMKANEIDEPMRVVSMMADQMQAALVGGDDYWRKLATVTD
jgi:hypothetical protein